ncbi:histidine phosphatase family protein [Phycicoccus duodecadis]|uniref:Alpha-ribazole phosphatase n=1 Tax=Phycicoccus duodecadis TaxID=173053 RepID=A0A2N3YGH4_9MICO|nr:histidine phosphatase family protein [Phycicoccus duodecadis]PKW25953.1 alpha-ribazole phosphatase [Phycicoccus duodecadis]
MSDLHCPARVFLARPGEAEDETGPPTAAGGGLTATGRDQARALAERVRDENVARVWSSPLPRAVQTAEIAAAVLGVPVVVRDGLRECDAGIPAGERIADVAARVRGVLEEVADTHRGEAVLVVSHGGAFAAGLPDLVGAPRTSGHDLTPPPGGTLALEADEDGWRRLP